MMWRTRMLGGPVAVLLVIGGCNSCQQAPELPAPVAHEGRLPRAPEAPVTPLSTPEVPPPGCAVVAAASVEEGTAPLEVHLTAEGMCTDAEGVFTWDFGDGSEPVHEQNPVHVYRKAGTYTAHVRIEDAANNAKDVDEQPITVTAD
jgi:PKD domain-containing protein